MTALQMGITIAVCTAATMLTRFLPFLIFSSKDQQPHHLCDDGFDGHVVGFQEAETVPDPLADLVNAHIAALVGDLCG